MHHSQNNAFCSACLEDAILCFEAFTGLKKATSEKFLKSWVFKSFSYSWVVFDAFVKNIRAVISFYVLFLGISIIVLTADTLSVVLTPCTTFYS